MGPHQQTGIVAAASCEDYLQGRIKKHELTRPDKEDDRVRHIETLDAQTGPVFLVYRALPEVDALVEKKLAGKPDVDFTAKDGVRHSSWTIAQPGEIALIEHAFSGIDSLYIADGHHRCAAAGRVFQTRHGAGHSGWFLSVIFPHNQVQILPYHRVLKDLNGQAADKLLARLETVFVIDDAGAAHPARQHQLGFYLQGKWRTLTFKPRYTATNDPAERLDVALLQTHVLAPLFGIENPRTSKRISFVGGIRGTNELEKLVNNGEGSCAFSMFATGIEDLMAIADAGAIMPPKSTWFEPKLRDGMFSHQIGDAG
jgi:uncharacterized protein (DUF1015 family)